MSKKRHKWTPVKNKMTEVNQCSVCGLYRFKALNSWFYSVEMNEMCLVDSVKNNGCNELG